jgi:hypothetical protein
MKKLCFFLVLVNVAYFLWQARTQERLPQLSINSATPSLMLFSELPSNSNSKLPKSIETNQMSETIPAASVNAPIPSEVSVAPTDEPPSVDPVVAPAQAPAAVAQTCFVLGGFIDQTAAEQAVEFLSERGIANKLSVIEKQGTGSYLVYLPPFQSRADALVKLHELKANGVDSFIIADGERINGISLGVFSKEESAKKLQNQLKDKGYSPLLANSSRISRQFSLQIASQVAQMLTESLKADISKKYAQDKLTQTDVPCPE